MSHTVYLGGKLVPREDAKVSVFDHGLRYGDECFLTGTAAEIVPVVSLDGRPIGPGEPGPLTRDLTRRFRTLTGQD